MASAYEEVVAELKLLCDALCLERESESTWISERGRRKKEARERGEDNGVDGKGVLHRMGEGSKNYRIWEIGKDGSLIPIVSINDATDLNEVKEEKAELIAKDEEATDDREEGKTSLSAKQREAIDNWIHNRKAEIQERRQAPRRICQKRKMSKDGYYFEPVEEEEFDYMEMMGDDDDDFEDMVFDDLDDDFADDEDEDNEETVCKCQLDDAVAGKFNECKVHKWESLMPTPTGAAAPEISNDESPPLILNVKFLEEYSEELRKTTSKMMMDTEERNGISKIRDLIRRQRQESEGGGGDDCSELDYVYEDADTYANEISELYSYTEVPEFKKNLAAYEAVMAKWEIPLQWQRLSPELRKSAVLRLVNQLELSNKSLRAEAARAVLYIAQGCWSEVQSDQEQQQWTRYNVSLLLKHGIFTAIVDLLSLEIECGPMAIRKPAVSLADSADLRVILSILYTMVETVRSKSEDDTDEFEEIGSNFKHELGQPIRDELLATKLLNMVIKFCGGSAPHFPIKKVLLLLWKVILVSLGGTPELRELKAKYREVANLPPLKEDTIEVSRTMRAASPPASATDLLDAQNERRNLRPLRRSLMKQSSLDESATLDLEMSDQIEEEMKEIEERRAMEESGQLPQPPSPRPMTPLPTKNKGLPWSPKVRQKDLDAFLDASRMKFVGFPIHGDRDTLAGLPAPIHEGVKVLKQHIYVSLAEWQVSREEELWRCPLSLAESEDDIPSTGIETLYAAMLPNLPQYIIALLKILLAAAPTSKSKSESINIMADVLPEEMPMTVVQSMKLGIDVARHKEIIVKAISSIILLLLKHTKINHVYQFEFISQHLVFANCIPLVLKFFNQNISAYITAKNIIALTDFPSCVLGEPPELTPESLELGEPQPYCWRNLTACINLLRILNKLTKWKHSRIMMLVVFKSAPILKRSLRVKHALLQLYILKLLKMQTKYLGRQWRKANMKTMSAIYQKVRHRLTDDWAYGNDLDARPWDFQAEECALRNAVDRFNNRRYGDSSKILPDFEPIDKCLTSVLGRPVQLTSTFKENYEVWLEQEVFKNPVDWDEVLRATNGIM